MFREKVVCSGECSSLQLSQSLFGWTFMDLRGPRCNLLFLRVGNSSMVDTTDYTHLWISPEAQSYVVRTTQRCLALEESRSEAIAWPQGLNLAPIGTTEWVSGWKAVYSRECWGWNTSQSCPCWTFMDLWGPWYNICWVRVGISSMVDTTDHTHLWTSPAPPISCCKKFSRVYSMEERLRIY